MEPSTSHTNNYQESNKIFKWESFGDASKPLKLNITSGRIIHNDLINWRRHYRLLSFHSLELLDSLLVNISTYFSVITYRFAEHLELVLNFFCLLDPHVACVLHKPHFDHINNREDPQWEFEFFDLCSSRIPLRSHQQEGGVPLGVRILRNKMTILLHQEANPRYLAWLDWIKEH
ncbi:hypothetical protein H5410_007633 [Solanum commersonii]|uniref:Uncharacterized protein n=1 Tax=Solanum commersonii TaxID=4109 RepID=A0A9J6AEN1_SOLCO|nr:hypothetical protein H5410_007633 [Solanum commersonii]